MRTLSSGCKKNSGQSLHFLQRQNPTTACSEKTRGFYKTLILSCQAVNLGVIAPRQNRSELTALCPEYETLGSLETETTLNCRMGARTRGVPEVRKCALAALLLLAAALPLAGREKDKLPYGEGLIVNIPLPVSEVEQVVGDVV